MSTYPEEEDLQRIREWNLGDMPGLFAFLRERWAYADCGYWSEEPGTDSLDKPITVYSVSTAGWSGNEELLSALQDNRIAWLATWQQSRRGGHYIFHGPARASPETGGEGKGEGPAAPPGDGTGEG